VNSTFVKLLLISTDMHMDGLNFVISIVSNGVLTLGIMLATMFRPYLVTVHGILSSCSYIMPKYIMSNLSQEPLS